jgi:feruloyl-CoA synthase
MKMKESDYKESHRRIETIRVDIIRQQRPDGTAVLRSSIPLEPFPRRLTDRLQHWAGERPDQVFIGQKMQDGKWETLTYAETFSRVERIGQALLDRNLSVDHPVVILSGNSIEHALVALAALHVGLPYSPIAPAYSLKSSDYGRLEQVVDQLSPEFIFVDDARKYEGALVALNRKAEIVASIPGTGKIKTSSFTDLLTTPVTGAVRKAYEAIRPDTVAKILYTSGSTGLPKGVVNTHGNISANWQQITQTFPFMREEGLEFIDWLPWNHTYGGNHNFGLALYNGGAIYIDDGNPTPEGIAKTVSSLKERTPTVYFSVPKGFEALLPYFRNDPQLGAHFFSKLKMLFNAGAVLPQHVWDAWEALSLEFAGENILIGSGLGCTESCPAALFASEPGGFAGLVGVPAPGLTLKLVPNGGRLEARYLGRNIFPAYWGQPTLTESSFDEEGFYCTGDALKYVDESDPNKGMIYDGRFTDDFKLGSGTWVKVGILRAQLIACGNGLIHDAVITGHDRDFVAAIVFPSLGYCRNLSGLGPSATVKEVLRNPLVVEGLRAVLQAMEGKATGSSSLVRRAVLADIELSMERGELTDKGSVNQGMVIRNHPDLVELIYSDPLSGDVIEVQTRSRI